MAQHEANGIDLVKKAEKKLKTGIMGSLFSGNKYEEAGDLLEKAITQFKLAKAWPLAASAFVQLADVHKKSECEHDAATNYVDAANCYLKSLQQDEAETCFRKAVDLFTELGSLAQAARYLKQLGEVLEKDGNMEGSVQVYKRAVDLYISENLTSDANKCKLKIAQYEAQQDKFEDAIEIFEDVARACTENNLLKFGAKDHLLNAMLCRFAYQPAQECAEATQTYEDIDISFGDSRQGVLVKTIQGVIEGAEGGIDDFTQAIVEYDRLTKLDPWRTAILLKVRKRIEAGGGQFGGGDELEEDFM